MIGSFGKAKGGGGGAKPLKKLTYKQLDKRQDALQALVTAGTATTKQEKRLATATTLLARRDARYAARHPVPPAPPPPVSWVMATFPTALPPDGHRWVYDSGTNAYLPQPIPLGVPIAPVAPYYGGSSGGGGGGAPDFSQFAYDPGAGFVPATPAPPAKSDLQIAMEAPKYGGLTGKIGLVAAAGVVAYLIFRKKSPRPSARSLVR